MPISTPRRSDRRKRELRANTAMPRAPNRHNRGPTLQEVEPFAVRPSIAWRLLDCGNTHGYELLAAGKLDSYLDGRSRRITMLSIKEYIASRLASNRATTGSPIEPPRRRRGRPRKSPEQPA
jgi:hypothetical protein